MRNSWIWILVIVVVVLGGLYMSGMIGRPTGPENQQPAPHAIDQTPAQ